MRMERPSRSKAASAVLSLFFSAFAIAVEPVDPAANQDVRAILNWLHTLPDRTTNRVISGQYFIMKSRKKTACEQIHEKTGKWPAAMETTFWQMHPWDDWPWEKRHRQQMKDHWDQGGLVSLHMPVPNPKNKTNQLDTDMTVEEYRQIYQEGTQLNKNLNEWLDRLASNLQWLQANGVTLFIRPFHEVAPVFWWGIKGIEGADYIKLFRYAVDYLIKKKGLHNLIIVYGPHYALVNPDYYPGDDYVDVVALDVYNNPPIANKRVQESYKALSGLGKPFFFGEVGWKLSRPMPRNVDLLHLYDARKDIIDAIQDKTPRAVYWSSWGGAFSPASQKNCKELYDHPWVMTRDEVDWRKRPATRPGVPPSATNPRR